MYKKRQAFVMTFNESSDQSSLNTSSLLTNSEKTSQLQPILAVILEARLKSNISHSDASNALNIQIHYLKAIEEGDLDTLPEQVYILGFVRSYANYLGLDAAKCVSDYKQQVLFSHHYKPILVSPSALQESMVPKRAMLILSFLLVVGGYLSWLYVSDKQEQKEKLTHDIQVFDNDDEDSTLTDHEPEVEEPFAHEEHALAPNATLENGNSLFQVEPSFRPENQEPLSPSEIEPKEPSGTADIVIVATHRSWIEIKDKEKIIYRGILNKGESYSIPKGEGLELTTGNAGGISFLVDGQITPALGQAGQVMRKLPLTKESLSVVASTEKPHTDITGENDHATARPGDKRFITE